MSSPFRQTWSREPLGKVASITVGGTPSTDVPEYWGGEVPWMASGDIHRYRIRDVDGRITRRGLQCSNAKLVAPGAVAIALAGQGKTRGTVAFTDIELATNQSVALVSTDREKLLPEFLFQSLVPRYEELRASSSGGGRGGLTKQILQRIEVSYPTLEEQSRIAGLLSAMDEQIGLLERRIEKTSLVKFGAVQGVIARLSDAPRKPLGKVAEVGGGVTLGRKFTGPGTREYPYLRVANVQDGHIDLTEVKTIRLPEAAAKRAMLMPGDVLMNEGGDFDKLGRGAVWNGEVKDCLHQNHVFRVRCDQSVLLPAFLALWAASEFGKKYFMLASKQSTNLASINSTQLKKFPVLLPTPDEQRAALRLAGAIDNELQRDRREVEKLRLQKQGLAYDLLTGKERSES